MQQEELKLQSDKLWVGNLDLRITEFKLLQILQKYGEIEHFNFVYHTNGPNIGQPKGFAFIKYKEAEDTINVLTKLNNKKIGSKNVAVRYAKHVEYDDDKSSKNLKISALGAGSSHGSLADKKSKIQLIEEQLRRYQNSSDDFELNRNAQKSATTEPLIKKYQFNKDVASTTSNRYQNYHKKKRKPY